MKAVDQSINAPLPSPDPSPTLLRVLASALLVAGVVFIASLFGILTRPLGFLAAFWPANAILLGLFVRFPRLASRWGWLAAIGGYMAADLLTGGKLPLTLWLTAANLVGVATGFWLFRRLEPADRMLRRPQSVLYLFGICLLAAVPTALVGAGIAPVAFGQSLLTGLEFWFTTELVNSLVVLPVILTAPVWSLKAMRIGRPVRRWRADLLHLAPLLALILSIVAGLLVRGPGAIAFPIPALLWCALTYSLFGTVLLTLAVSICILIAVSTGVLHAPPSSEFIYSTLSVRLGVIFLALGPLTVASINAARNELLRTLDYAANHDSLTGTLLRRAFIERSEACIAQQRQRSASVAVLMLDIDHFKRINDQYGHASGDTALIEFVAAITPALRAEDLLGRLGGEEFAVLMPDVSLDAALRVAERLRSQVQAHPVALDSGETINLTVSIGLNWQADAGTELRAMLLSADQALYQAKAAGRNQTVSR
ncbi:GGDEF domain-containing protein [Pseudomonas anguilliseptica]|uniref:GGDEF domain-containing protein n=1 Tax=Pseudomonas anguilliseptica TaxID=53406 RepID=UPI0037370D60